MEAHGVPWWQDPLTTRPVWVRLPPGAPFIPTGPSRGSHPGYDNLRRAWQNLLVDLPMIDGWTITGELPDIDVLGQAYLYYFQVSEPPFSVYEAGQKPGTRPAIRKIVTDLAGQQPRVAGVRELATAVGRRVLSGR